MTDFFLLMKIYKTTVNSEILFEHILIIFIYMENYYVTWAAHNCRATLSMAAMKIALYNNNILLMHCTLY